MEDVTYNNYLSELLDNHQVPLMYQDNLLLDKYLTLISLNNNHYDNLAYQNEMNIIEDFLRKINNLKVKIQLKRKEAEIEDLIIIIKAIYEANYKIIAKYNLDNDDIINVIESKNPISITSIIDKLTKTKITKIENKPKYDKLRNDVINNIFITNHYIKDNILYIGDNITLDLNDFYLTFDYLLDINNYQVKYLNEENNQNNKEIVKNIINNITNNEPLTSYIPIVLTYIFTKNNQNYEMINTSRFNIENIKITELYSFANNNQLINNTNAKWKNVIIPNSYLYQKIKLMVNSGKYYFHNNIFTMEIINDFKISITKEDLIAFLKTNLSNN